MKSLARISKEANNSGELYKRSARTRRLRRAVVSAASVAPNQHNPWRNSRARRKGDPAAVTMCSPDSVAAVRKRYTRWNRATARPNK